MVGNRSTEVAQRPLRAHKECPAFPHLRVDTGSLDLPRFQRTKKTATDDFARMQSCCATNQGVAEWDCPVRMLRQSRCGPRRRWEYARRRTQISQQSTDYDAPPRQVRC